MKLALQIAGGILIASAVGWLFVLLLAGAAVHTEDQQLSRALQAGQQVYQTAVAREQAQDIQYREEQAAGAAAQRQAQMDVLRAQGAAEQAAIEEQATAQAQATAKATAWSTYYHPKTSCEKPADWAATVECGNEYMRAKRTFEAQWSQRAERTADSTP